MKILLFGKNGQVGRELQYTLFPLGELAVIGREEVDLQNLLHLHDILCAYAPDIIVNASAYTAVDKAETEASLAYTINAKAVHVMANYARDNHVLLVHYSTDYVFDGEKRGAYLETDTTHPLSVYGKSKRAGEEAILESNCNNLIFRTSWVFSTHGNNFVKTILKLAKERESLNVVADQYGAPTSAKFIAHITAQAIQSYKNNNLQNGIYHLTSTGETSWHNFACYIVENADAHGAKLKLRTEHIFPILTQAYPLPAKRPKNSCMNTHALSSVLKLKFPDWKVDVESIVRKMITDYN